MALSGSAIPLEKEVNRLQGILLLSIPLSQGRLWKARVHQGCKSWDYTDTAAALDTWANTGLVSVSPGTGNRESIGSGRSLSHLTTRM